MTLPTTDADRFANYHALRTADMARRNAEPKITLRLTPRGIFPATGLDAELLSRLPSNSDLEAMVLKVARSKALAAWWLLMSRVSDCDDRWPTSRALSNSMLLRMNMVESEALIGGGERREPMSLADFSEDQLWKLVDHAKEIVASEILPGVNLEDLLRRRA